MANLSNIIKISQANYNTLSTQGSVIIGGVTYTYDSNALYVIEETGQVVPVSGTNDGTNWTTITIDGTTKNIPSGGGGSGTVTSVGAGTGLSISGTATINPTVNIASGYKLPTTTEWSNKSTVSGTISGNNWSAININGTSKNIPQGTVTSARVQAGTGLSSSQSTAQSTTLDTTISIDSGYKLPTTDEWNALQIETFRNYGVSSTSPYFKLYTGDGTLVKSITNDISAAYNPSNPNWGILYEYFRETIFNMGFYAEGSDGNFVTGRGPLSCAGLFIADNDFDNNIGSQISETTKWMSDNLLSYFTLAVSKEDIDSFKVEVLGGSASLAECTLKITLYTKFTQEYTLQIVSLWNDSNNIYQTDGWHLAGGSRTKLPTTDEWKNNSLYNAISGFSTSNGCATSDFYKSTLWSLTDIANITEPYDGMKVVIRIPLTGVSTGGTLLSIDGGTTYHPVAYNKDTVLTTHYAANSNKVFIYNANQTMNGYLTMNALNSKPSDWSTNYNKYYRKAKSATKSYDWILNTSTTWDNGTYDYAKGGTATSFTGVWQGEANYYSDANSIGYQLRTNSALWANKTYNGSTGVSMNRYTLLFEVEDGLSGAATSIGTGTSKVTIPFKYIPGGVIKYYTTSGAIAVNANFTATGLWDQYAIDLRYTFNIGTAVLTANKPVYIRMSVNSDGTLSPVYSGSPSHPIVTALPTSEDNYVYVYLGVAYSTSSIELYNNHPIYYYKNGHIQLWSGSLIPDASFLYDIDEGEFVSTITAAQYNLLAAANAFDVTDDGNTTYRFYRSIDDKGATNNPLHFTTHRIFNRVEELIITDNYNVTHTSSQIMQSYNASSPYIVRKLTQAQYDALATKDSYTIYIIVG